MADTIVNKVAQSGLFQLDLEDFLPKGDLIVFELKDHLFMGMILKEKDFREALKNLDWDLYKEKNVSIICSVDAVIPVWAYMLIASYLQPVAREFFVGSAEEMQKHLILKNISNFDVTPLLDQRVVVKGCGDIPIESYAYAEITRILTPVVKSIMYGEPCSTVPVYKKK